MIPLNAEPRIRQGLFDTNILIHWARLDPAALPEDGAITTITIAELAAGVHAARDSVARGERLEMLQRAESVFEPLPFDIAAARAYGRVTAAVRAAGRSPRARVSDQMIASIAVARGLPVCTTNPKDYAGLDDLVAIIAVPRPNAPRQ